MRLAQANLASNNDINNFVKKTDFNDQLKNLNNFFFQIKQNIYLNELLEKGKGISTKDHSLLPGRIHLINDDEFQNMLLYQPTFNTLKYKNTIRNQKGYIILNL